MIYAENKKLVLRSAFMLCALITLTAIARDITTPAIWKSKFRKLSFEYAHPWELLPSYETNEETLVSIVDKTDRASYIIRMGDDVSQEESSNKEYYQEIKQNILEAHKENKLIKEDDIIFKNQRMHRMMFLLHTEKYGQLRSVSLIKRTGREVILLQISNPVKALTTLTDTFPSKMLLFNEKLNFTLK